MGMRCKGEGSEGSDVGWRGEGKLGWVGVLGGEGSREREAFRGGCSCPPSLFPSIIFSPFSLCPFYLPLYLLPSSQPFLRGVRGEGGRKRKERTKGREKTKEKTKKSRKRARRAGRKAEKIKKKISKSRREPEGKKKDRAK